MSSQHTISQAPFRNGPELFTEASVLRCMPDAVLQTGPAGLIRALNPAAEALTGWSEAEALGHTLSDLVQFAPEPDQDFVLAAVDAILSGRSASEVSAGKIGLPRRRKHILAWISAGTMGSIPDRSAVFVIRDVTSLDRLQRDYFRTRHLEGLQRLAGGLANQCMNLITAVQGSVEALTRSGKLGEREARHLHSLGRALDGTSAVTRQLLAFGKRLPADTRIVDLNSAIRSTLPLLEETAGRTCSLVLNLGINLGRIEIDPSHLEDTLLALVRNASQSMPDGGTIQIATREHLVTPQQALQFVDLAAGEYVLLEVSDTGSGICTSGEDQLFEPFFSVRAHADNLGLAGAYGCAKQSGGHMWHESTPRVGTRFFLCWPKAEAPGLEAVQAPDGGRETVLVLEHDTGTRELVRRSLLTRDYHVLEAATSSEALRVSRNWDGQIDLLLVNVFTSSATGPEVAGKLRGVRPGIKVLYMSSYAARVLQQAGAPKLEGSFIQKPFSAEALARRVRNMLDQPLTR